MQKHIRDELTRGTTRIQENALSSFYLLTEITRLIFLLDAPVAKFEHILLYYGFQPMTTTLLPYRCIY